MFVVFVAPPGVGKDQAIKPVKDFWAATGQLKVAPVSVSHKGLIDELADGSSQKSVILNGSWFNYHSMLVAAPELGVILPEHNLGFLSLLNELFQCYDIFDEKVRGRPEPIRIERPHLHILAGTQPKYLHELLPESAFGMGFTARIIMVYWGTPVKTKVFRGKGRSNKPMFDALLEDLVRITEMSGQFSVDDGAVEDIEHWHSELAGKTEPGHSKLVHYNARRILHVLKLSMVYSASRSSEMIIRKEDFARAIETLYEAEKYMPEIFKEMKSGGHIDHIEETFHFVMTQWGRTQRPVPEHRIIHFLMSRVPANQITYMLDTMIKSGMLSVVGNLANTNTRIFKPEILTKPEE